MKIKIEFFTYWHCSSGLSGGGESDALVVRNHKGLPYIPGKTLKGHIKEMAMSLNDEEFVKRCFGIDDKSEGECYFSNAEIDGDIEDELKDYLFKTIASTKIEDGIAVDKSLREIEVVVPLTLFATIENCPKEYKEKIKKAFMQVKRVGLNRSRGLGRCEITLIGDSDD